ncbi:ammonium transporter [Ponticoccus sp. SC2-23]|uniref:ammonium transporter n=1 Tax=Alexandriicola marinus TaxID=2081710 RepID=UPI000FD8A9A2|nr:ammonium transporter [Alexandriicola marinus]MBM1221904.1 ammonium transporter [Ponticoccus sp. SC6-9]MBM1226255.1 ammonium transporter [Ponticoccus sp. SC6-15]MBM1230851.1 ammonium transporter [Ponticoccus sp. SC6-38]MBM1235308.1 ammonium transporter [Ponticoccus sp. SC6-45]MBM1239873.1 ammonium transporter [Ponticoccus sp. SC6-49]MBM1244017.1 ammonium transporter [Ponticoccus sp. SC2-64]MBM1248832.1 ammonium transporter [Ponticoccus sp. SC6-42]MBM1253528.1 ammonium transporter [Pontico
MLNWKSKLAVPAMALTAGILLPELALAQEAEAAAPGFDEIGPYIMTTLLFLVGGFLVFWMAAGFAMLEAGLVRSKNVTMQLTKNIALFSIASIMYWLVGFNLMYPGDFNGYFAPNFVPTVLEPVGLAAADASLDYASVASDFFFQLMFVAATASIVSGALAERIKLWPFLIFVVILTGIMYPISGSWQWGGGWLSELGFSDFAGSTIVHSVGGWAALAGALILGPRLGKYKDGRVNPMPGSNLALATLGTFILWLGWFGFNGGSQLAAGTVGDITDVGRIFANTNMAAASGAVAALILTQILYKKVDLTMVLNGALAGLVSITAEPLAPSLFGALLTGAVGGVIVVFTVPLLDKLKIDDVVGAIPVHLFAGIWGTLAVAFYTGNWGAQITGIIAYGVFTFVGALVIWVILKGIMGIRVSEEAEINGLDTSELGMEAYPDFTKG